MATHNPTPEEDMDAPEAVSAPNGKSAKAGRQSKGKGRERREVQALLERGRVKGFLTYDEVNDALSRYQHQGLDAIDTWVDFWRKNGRRYTGVEPYLVLQSNLNRIVGKGTRLRRLARQTSEREIAAKFQ